jgi:outer membrane protein assembly factor BamD (BamD/ComL family)
LENQGQWTQAKQAYEGFLQKHSKSRAIDEVKFRIANIQLEHEKQPDQAIVLYKELWGKLSIPWRPNVGLKIGDCYAWMDDYAAAIKAWREVVRLSSQKQLSEDGAQAFFRMARANFWRDSISAAQDILDSIMDGNPTSPTFNDAVLYSALLDDGGVYKAVRAFATGDLGMFKNDFLPAAENFATAADLLKSSKVAQWCRYQQALALRAAGKPSEAVAVLDTFITSYPTSVDLDRSVYMRAVIQLEDLNEDAAALEALQKFLIDYPRSPYLEQARRKARILSARVS